MLAVAIAAFQLVPLGIDQTTGKLRDATISVDCWLPPSSGSGNWSIRKCQVLVPMTIDPSSGRVSLSYDARIAALEERIARLEAASGSGQSADCPGPIISVSGGTVAVGPGWSPSTPCVAGTNRITRGLALSATGECAAWFWIDGGVVKWSSSADTCISPPDGRVSGVPPPGSYALGAVAVVDGAVKAVYGGQSPIFVARGFGLAFPISRQLK